MWWQCPESPDHVYLTSVRTRTRKGYVCPYCSNKKVSVTNSLARVFPELAREWHPVLNEGLRPEDVTCACRTHSSFFCLGSLAPSAEAQAPVGMLVLTCACLPLLHRRHRDDRCVVASRGSVCWYDGVEGVDCETHALSAIHGPTASARPLFRPGSSTDAGACGTPVCNQCTTVCSGPILPCRDLLRQTSENPLSSVRQSRDVACCLTRLGMIGNRRKR